MNLQETRASLGGKGGTLERRTIEVLFEEVEEVRVEGDGDVRWIFRGLACRTEVAYEVYDYYGSFTETIGSGAFRATLAENPTVLFLIQHYGLPLANTKSDTMRLWESERGLEVEADMAPDDPRAQSVMSAVRRKDVTEMSFGFRVTGQKWSDDYSDRYISAVNLHRGDVSIVSYGANPYTDTSAGDSMEEGPDTEPLEEDGDDSRSGLLLQQQLEEQLLVSA